MPKLPVLSGSQAVTIPHHKTLGKGLLRKLIRDADITIEALIGLL